MGMTVVEEPEERKKVSKPERGRISERKHCWRDRGSGFG